MDIKLTDVKWANRNVKLTDECNEYVKNKDTRNGRIKDV